MAKALRAGLRNGGLRRGGLRPGLGNGSLFAIAPLDLFFARNRTLDERVTFTRASSATYVGSNGALRTAATNEARFDHNPTTGESLGLLVEEQRTNLLQRSEDLNDGIWTLVSGTVSTNSQTAPSGALTADKLIGTNGGPSGQVAQGVTITSGATVTGSIFVKAGGFDRLEMVLLSNNNTTPYGRVTIDPNTGAITSAASTANGGTNASASVVAYPNGWYRIVLTVTYPAVTAAGMRCVVFSSDASNGDGVKGVFIWGAQLEAGAFPTSYIPTTTAAATRSADVASITGTNFSSWYRQDEGTMLAAGIIANTGSNRFIADITDATINEEIALYWATSFSSLVTDNSVTQANSFGGTVTAGSPGLHSFAYKANDFQGYGNAVALATDTSGTVPTVNRLTIGSRVNGTFVANGTIRRLTYWPTRLANPTLQAITQ